MGTEADTSQAAQSPKLVDLQIESLSVWYGAFQALREITLDVRKDEILTLLGPSGSGKTTLLLCLAGFLPTRHGRVVLRGQDISSYPPNRREIGMVFQNYMLFPHRTVFQNVAYPLRLRGKTRLEVASRVTEMLDLLHLQGMEKRMPHQLSGGQQQRVALARALAFNPCLLLLDEPLGSVDRKLRIELQSEIRRVQRASRTTLVYVTHDQEEAMAISDRIAILRNGEIQQIGTPRDVYTNPCNLFVADFYGSANLMSVRILAVDDSTCEVELAGCKLGGIPRPVWPIHAADGAILMVRPEHLQISNRPTGIPCNVEEATFQGESVVFKCTLRDRTPIIMRRPAHETETLGSGGELCLEVTESKAKLFPRAEGR